MLSPLMALPVLGLEGATFSALASTITISTGMAITLTAFAGLFVIGVGLRMYH